MTLCVMALSNVLPFSDQTSFLVVRQMSRRRYVNCRLLAHVCAFGIIYPLKLGQRYSKIVRSQMNPPLYNLSRGNAFYDGNKKCNKLVLRFGQWKKVPLRLIY